MQSGIIASMGCDLIVKKLSKTLQFIFLLTQLFKGAKAQPISL